MDAYLIHFLSMRYPFANRDNDNAVSVVILRDLILFLLIHNILPPPHPEYLLWV
jgi:hypothetical protein